MGEPIYGDIVENEVNIRDAEATSLICKLADRQTSAAYWVGRCEGLELIIIKLHHSHTREIESIERNHLATVAYLKDRLESFEVVKKPPHPLPGC